RCRSLVGCGTTRHTPSYTATAGGWVTVPSGPVVEDPVRRVIVQVDVIAKVATGRRWVFQPAWNTLVPSSGTSDLHPFRGLRREAAPVTVKEVQDVEPCDGSVVVLIIVTDLP